MKSFKLAAAYLFIPAMTVSYELSVRVLNPANSEFAGMLSAAATMPSIFIVGGIGAKVFGVRPGDSHPAFVGVFAAAALLNAALIFGATTFVSGKGR